MEGREGSREGRIEGGIPRWGDSQTAEAVVWEKLRTLKACDSSLRALRYKQCAAKSFSSLPIVPIHVNVCMSHLLLAGVLLLLKQEV